MEDNILDYYTLHKKAQQTGKFPRDAKSKQVCEGCDFHSFCPKIAK
jgi:hypothetical protein